MAIPSTSTSKLAGTSSRSDANDTSYTAMNDVEAIGTHCHHCRQKDFLPFRCESCKRRFCLEHRTEDAHHCEKKGAWARERQVQRQKEIANIKVAPVDKKTAQENAPPCAELGCSQKVDLIGKVGVDCDGCSRKYCWKHRLPEDHDCKSKQAEQTAFIRQQREKGLAALAKLRLWGAEKKADLTAQSRTMQTKLSTPTATKKREKLRKVNELKQTAKGDAKVKPEDRVYVFLESAIPRPSPSPSPSPAPGAASSGLSKPKFTTAKAFYDKTITCGRILDAAARDLMIPNNNNREQDENEKLHLMAVRESEISVKRNKVWDIVTNKSLAFQQVENGDIIVVYKGPKPVDRYADVNV